MYGIIYKVISPSGKIYIGQTIGTLPARKRGHRSGAYRKNCKEYNYAISRAIRKYGDGLKWTILHNNILMSKLDKLEIKEIKNHDSYNSGYNSTLGGGGNRGTIPSKETRKKMAEARMGEKNHFYGKRHSEEAKKKIGKASKNRIVSLETRKKLSKCNSGENNNRAILNLKKAKEIRKKYATGNYTRKELSETYGVSESTIGDIAKYRSWNK